MEQNKQLAKVKRTIMFCMFGFFVVLGVSMFSFVQVGQLKRRNARADEYILALQEENDNMQTKINGANDSNYTDTVARQNLNMIKDGEIIYYFD